MYVHVDIKQGVDWINDENLIMKLNANQLFDCLH